ncbi:hypothetical protein Ahy_A01g004329 isoform A [Arachis hypogaea]|uniref:Uncharacterized protein n=1 Tax=Arachis hypogaea TaxID=3818 RepID=A0A445EVR6_ARAHY|nr:hypothetical protein Ahy_A01g004329 isoform A [Arachis hypogaea]
MFFALYKSEADFKKTGVCGCDRFGNGSIGDVLKTIVKKDGYRGRMDSKDAVPCVRGWEGLFPRIKSEQHYHMNKWAHCNIYTFYHKY